MMDKQLYTCRWTGRGAISFRGRTYLHGQIDDFELSVAKELHESDGQWECLEYDKLIEASEASENEQEDIVLDLDNDSIDESGKSEESVESGESRESGDPEGSEEVEPDASVDGQAEESEEHDGSLSGSEEGFADILDHEGDESESSDGAESPDESTEESEEEEPSGRNRLGFRRRK